MNRLDILVELVRRGWAFGAAEDPFTLASPLMMNPAWLDGSMARLAVLLDYTRILPLLDLGISGKAPHHYYICLLQLTDVSPINALGDAAPTRSDAQFNAILKGAGHDGEEGALPLPDAPVVAPICDAASPAELMIAPSVVTPTLARLPVCKTLSDGRMARIHFDRGSHSSRRFRALTECRFPGHGRCRMDRFLDEFESDKVCIAHFLSWHEAAHTVASAAEHLAVRVDPDVVSVWMGTLWQVLHSRCVSIETSFLTLTSLVCLLVISCVLFSL